MSEFSVFNACPDQEPVEAAVAARPGPPPVESLLATLSKQLPPLAPVKQQQVILPSHWSILWILPSDWSISPCILPSHWFILWILPSDWSILWILTSDWSISS